VIAPVPPAAVRLTTEAAVVLRLTIVVDDA